MLKPVSPSEINFENQQERKEVWTKPQIQELEARHGTLGSLGLQSDMGGLAS